MSRRKKSDHDQDDTEVELVSKTQLKKEMHVLQKLGEELITLTSGQLDKLPLPEALRIAIEAAQKMTKHRALYRQRQYIGKLMRHLDAEPIQTALDHLRHPERLSKERFHRVEQWRDRLLHDEQAATDFVLEYSNVDRQQFGQKLRAARKAQQTGKPVGAERALFRFIDASIAVSERTDEADEDLSNGQQ